MQIRASGVLHLSEIRLPCQWVDSVRSAKIPFTAPGRLVLCSQRRQDGCALSSASEADLAKAPRGLGGRHRGNLEIHKRLFARVDYDRQIADFLPGLGH